MHKSILCAFSEVFEKMFQVDMVEKLTGVVELKDIEYKDLKNLVELMYGRDLDFPLEDIISLMLLAERFDILNLKTKCKKFILEQVSFLRM